MHAIEFKKYLIVWAPVLLPLQPALNTEGGSVVIHGNNFGADPLLVWNATTITEFDAFNRSVTVGNTTCSVTAWNHSSIHCVVEPGYEQVWNRAALLFVCITVDTCFHRSNLQ